MSEIRTRLRDLLPTEKLLDQSNPYPSGWNDAIACCLDRLERNCKLMYGEKIQNSFSHFSRVGEMKVMEDNYTMLVLDIQPIKHETCRDILKEIYESGQTSWKDSDRIKAALERENERS